MPLSLFKHYSHFSAMGTEKRKPYFTLQKHGNSFGKRENVLIMRLLSNYLAKSFEAVDSTNYLLKHKIGMFEVNKIDYQQCNTV